MMARSHRFLVTTFVGARSAKYEDMLAVFSILVLFNEKKLSFFKTKVLTPVLFENRGTFS